MKKEEKIFRISEIISKSLGENLNEDEVRELEVWLAEDEHNRELLKEWKSVVKTEEKIEAYKRLKYSEAWENFRKVRQEKLVLRRRKNRSVWLKYAAVFVISLGVAVVLLRNQGEDKVVQVAETTVSAGRSQAVLVLSSGERQTLNEEGKRIEDGGMTIKTESGTINYSGQVQSEVKGENVFHTLEVPRGGEYFMVLADGTKVWLNADTRLKYPVAFGGGVRKVFLEGEAYFEVAKDVRRMFVVETAHARVKVLGTSFDVCAYEEDGKVFTTLEEGSVEMEKADYTEALRMIPGEQVCLIEDGRMEKYEVETELFTSWRSGRLVFKNMSLEELMRNISRWYDVEVKFKKEHLKRIVFTGDVKKYEDLDEVLEFVELTSEARFMIEGDIITIY